MNSPLSDTCRVCGHASRFAFTRAVIGRPVSYFDCGQCGYVQTQMPDWLGEAYSSVINSVDTGIMQRNLLNVGRVVMTLACLRRLGTASVIDHAGGYGILVRMLRDVGVDAYWRDKFCDNLMARGFEASTPQPCDLLTAFEVFEHLVHPLNELQAMLQEAPAVLLSTDLVTSAEPPAPDWWYYGPEHGQHVGFFRPATLAWMARDLGCHHATDGHSLHLFTRAPVPRHWRLMVRLRRLSGLVVRLSLRSKTNTDFEHLRKRA